MQGEFLKVSHDQILAHTCQLIIIDKFNTPKANFLTALLQAT
jgi:hypothetical protein